MIGLNPVVQNGHNDSLAGVALLPSRMDVHVEAVLSAAILKQKTHEISE